jgi:hypothetical protein
MGPKFKISVPAKRTNFVTVARGDRKCKGCGAWIGRDENPCGICGYRND